MRLIDLPTSDYDASAAVLRRDDSQAQGVAWAVPVPESAIVPIGALLWWMFATPPAGWHLLGEVIPLDSNLGTLLSNNGIANNGDGTITIPSPPSAAFVLAASGGVSPLQSGGTESETLTIQQIPQHNHDLFLRDALPDPYPSGSEILIIEGAKECDSYNRSVSASVRWAGGGQPHNNMPPYWALNLIIYGGS